MRSCVIATASWLATKSASITAITASGGWTEVVANDNAPPSSGSAPGNSLQQRPAGHVTGGYAKRRKAGLDQPHRTGDVPRKTYVTAPVAFGLQGLLYSLALQLTFRHNQHAPQGLSDLVPTLCGDGAIHSGRDGGAEDGLDHDPPPRREAQRTPKRRLTGSTLGIFSCRIKADILKPPQG